MSGPVEEPGIFTPQQKEIRRIVKEIISLLDQKRGQDAGTQLKILELLPVDAITLTSIKAAIAVEQGDRTSARNLYQELAKTHPEVYAPRFNLAELLMMESQYAEARKDLIALLDQFPDNRLVMYKILLTFVMEKNTPMHWIG